jgi:hypothetical protein
MATSNTSPKLMSLAGLTLRGKIERCICIGLGFIFIFLTFYTVAKSIALLPAYVAQHANITVIPVLLIFTALIFMEITTAYGFLYQRSWIRYTISLHAASILVTALGLLPLLHLEKMTIETLLNGIPYMVTGVALWFFKTLRTPQKPHLGIIILYLFAILVSVSLQLLYR